MRPFPRSRYPWNGRLSARCDRRQPASRRLRPTLRPALRRPRTPRGLVITAVHQMAVDAQGIVGPVLTVSTDVPIPDLCRTACVARSWRRLFPDALFPMPRLASGQSGRSDWGSRSALVCLPHLISSIVACSTLPAWRFFSSSRDSSTCSNRFVSREGLETFSPCRLDLGFQDRQWRRADGPACRGRSSDSRQGSAACSDWFPLPPSRRKSRHRCERPFGKGRP